MISNIDQLLLSDDQQAALKRYKLAWSTANQKGDTAGMQAAHDGAERIRAAAGYSGGETGDQYRLLEKAGTPAGYNGYERLVSELAAGGMNAIAAGRDSALAKLEEQRGEIVTKADHDEAAARSAVWNTRRLAEDGLLTRGLANTGIADVITALALNQASANAYQALLDRREALAANDTARAEAEANARSEAAELQQELGSLLGDAYLQFYDSELAQKENAHDRAQALQLQKMKNQAALNEAERDYFYELALAKLKREWDVEDNKRGW